MTSISSLIAAGAATDVQSIRQTPRTSAHSGVAFQAALSSISPDSQGPESLPSTERIAADPPTNPAPAANLPAELRPLLVNLAPLPPSETVQPAKPSIPTQTGGRPIEVVEVDSEPRFITRGAGLIPVESLAGETGPNVQSPEPSDILAQLNAPETGPAAPAVVDASETILRPIEDLIGPSPTPLVTEPLDSTIGTSAASPAPTSEGGGPAIGAQPLEPQDLRTASEFASRTAPDDNDVVRSSLTNRPSADAPVIPATSQQVPLTSDAEIPAVEAAQLATSSNASSELVDRPVAPTPVPASVSDAEIVSSAPDTPRTVSQPIDAAPNNTVQPDASAATSPTEAVRRSLTDTGDAAVIRSQAVPSGSSSGPSIYATEDRVAPTPQPVAQNDQPYSAPADPARPAPEVTPDPVRPIGLNDGQPVEVASTPPNVADQLDAAVPLSNPTNTTIAAPIENSSSRPGDVTPTAVSADTETAGAAPLARPVEEPASPIQVSASQPAGPIVSEAVTSETPVVVTSTTDATPGVPDQPAPLTETVQRAERPADARIAQTAVPQVAQTPDSALSSGPAQPGVLEAAATAPVADAATGQSTSPTLPQSVLAPSAPTAPVQQTQGLVPTQPVQVVAAPAEIVQIVNERLSSGNVDDRQIQVQLDPPELGRVSIDFRFDGNGLQGVVVTAETPEAVRQLRNLHQELVVALEQQGLSSDDLVYQDQSEQREQQQHRVLSQQLFAAAEDIIAIADPAQPAIATSSRPAANASGLDIRV